MFITNPYCDETVTYAEKLLSFLGSSLVSSWIWTENCWLLVLKCS